MLGTVVQTHQLYFCNGIGELDSIHAYILYLYLSHFAWIYRFDNCVSSLPVVDIVCACFVAVDEISEPSHSVASYILISISCNFMTKSLMML